MNIDNGTITSGHNRTYWIESMSPDSFQTITADQNTDVVIVGGGIAGLSVAYCAAMSGKKVIVLEDGFIGSGETGRTTAHLVNALDDRYSVIEEHFGEKGAKLAAESHTAAIDFIENTIRHNNIQCDFRRVDGYLFLDPTDNIKTLEDERDATQRAGIETFLLSHVPGLPAESSPSLHFPSQAQFHPMKYLKGLARAIEKHDGTIYTESRVEEFSKKGVKVNGYFVQADHIVVATNSPVNDLVTMHTKQFPFRTYVIGGLIKKSVIEPALWWDTGNQKSKWYSQPYHYVRLQDYDENNYLLIAGGEDHKTGQADKEEIPEEERYQALEKWTRAKFPLLENIIHRWSGQVMEPIDHLGFIGKNPGDENTYIVTGDSGNGMTHGTIAGMLITDLINKKENPWQKIYDPARLMFDVAGTYAKEIGSMAGQYLDFLTPGDINSAKEIEPGDGAIMRVGMKKIAVFKDEQGMVHAFSAVCPHLGCVVQWNREEKSFDCPCHGSRFTCTGKVVNGPAISDLKEVKVTGKMEA